jgi:hypothetical protein
MSHESDRVLVLLQQLSMLKELNDGDSKADSPDVQRIHQERHREIVAEIKALAKQKKGHHEQSQLFQA